MPRKYSDDPVQRYLDVCNNTHLPPATKAKTLTAIAYNMDEVEIAETVEKIIQEENRRTQLMHDIGAPQIIIDAQARRLAGQLAYLNRAFVRNAKKCGTVPAGEKW